MASALKGTFTVLAWGVGAMALCFIVGIGTWYFILSPPGNSDDMGPGAVVFFAVIGVMLTLLAGLLGMVLGGIFGLPKPGRTRETTRRAAKAGLLTLVVGTLLTVLGWWAMFRLYPANPADGALYDILGGVLNLCGLMVLPVIVAAVTDSRARKRSRT